MYKSISFNEKYPNENIRALSWKQPFASLMLQGKVETRVWDSKYFGWVLICASKQPYSSKKLEETSGEHQIRRIKEFFPTGEQITGKAIAIGRLVTSKPMNHGFALYSTNNYFRNELENECFVKYKSELFLHRYEDVQPIIPFDWDGKQGWATLTEEQKSKIILI